MKAENWIYPEKNLIAFFGLYCFLFVVLKAELCFIQF
jgi:hypothetical protein